MKESNTFCEIKGFPMYLYNVDTGDVISRHQEGHAIKVSRLANRVAPMVRLRQNGKSRIIMLERLRYAISHGINYDELPHDFCITRDGAGGFCIMTKEERTEKANIHNRRERRDNRLDVIDTKIRELQIMRRCYDGGDHNEALMYIESRKPLLLGKHMKRFSRTQKSAEIHYQLALERIADMIDNGRVTELTCTMLHLMNQERQKLAAERPLPEWI